MKSMKRICLVALSLAALTASADLRNACKINLLGQSIIRDFKAGSPSTPELSTHPAWGAGKIHASDGIRKVIANYPAAVSPQIADYADKLYVNRISGNAYEVMLPGADTFEAELYNMAGARVATAHGKEGIATIAPPVMPGIYMLRAGRHTAKIAIR